MKKLRVLSLATLYPNDLAPNFGIFVARQMEAVAARGDAEVVLVSPLGLPPFPLSLHPRYRAMRALPHEELRGGVRVLRPRFTLLPLIGAHWNAGAIFRAVLPLARRLHHEAPFDLIDAQFFHPDGAAAARLGAALHLPWLIKARGADIHHWGQHPATAGALKAAGLGAAGLLAVSESLREDMIALGLPAGRISIHRTGLDHALFRPIPREEARAALDLPQDCALIVSVGALIPRKGQALVIEALAELPDVRLALAGTGPDDAALRQQVERLDLTDRVHFLGAVPHDALPNLLAAASVMVLPSASEGLANAWVEALACGTPLVISDAGGAREVVSDPSAGRIVERNAPGIADAVRELLAAPPAQSDVARHAERFSWATNAAELVEYWQRLSEA